MFVPFFSWRMSKKGTGEPSESLVGDMEALAKSAYRHGRRVVILVVGSTVVAVGLVLLVTPGPAIVVIPVGLAILAIEFAWARRWLRKMGKTVKDVQNQIMKPRNDG
jgi:tellurite resistance protein TerC